MWSEWVEDGLDCVRRRAGDPAVEVRVTPPVDAPPLIPASDPWRWSVRVAGAEVAAGAMDPRCAAPLVVASWTAMQAAREWLATKVQNADQG